MDLSQIRPYGPMVLIKELPPDYRVNGILFIPDTPTAKMQMRRGDEGGWGIVVAVGEGGRHQETNHRIPTNLTPGDKVMYKGWIADLRYFVDGEDDLFLAHINDVWLREEEEGDGEIESERG